MMRSKTFFPILALSILTFPAAVLAQCDEDKLTTVFDAYECFYNDALGEETADQVVDANNATTTPDAFAGRIHSSYQDFLNLFSFAVNKVEESDDGQALLIRFNPLRRGANLLGATLAVSKPSLFSGVTDAIPAAERPAASAELDKKLEDTDDLTWSLSYSLQTTKCDLSRTCWGRTPRTYRQALSGLIAELAGEIELPDQSNPLFIEISNCAPPGFASGSVFQLKLQEAKAQCGDIMETLQQAASLNAAQTLEGQKAFVAAGLGNLATLIDNQPQISLTGSYRDLGPLSGPDETAATIEIQKGRNNLNTLYGDCDGSLNCVSKKLKSFNGDDALATDKFVFTASYKKQDKFSLASLGLPADVATFPGVRLDSNTEIKVRLQWGRQLRANLNGLSNLLGPAVTTAATSPTKARWDLAVNGIRNSKGQLLTENRWVASWSLTVPLNAQMSLPLTVMYANKPEFLDQPRKQYGAHLGITYRLPWERAGS